MKKLFTLLFSLVATTALWAEDFEVDGIYYKILTDKTNEVAVTYRGSSYVSYDNEYSGSLTIPSTVTYNGTTYSVTSIGSEAFRGCSSLTSINIPYSVTSIGRSAFYECSSLTSITIPNSVTSIGDDAFCICSSLSSVTIGNSVTSIGELTFYGCSSLASMVVESGNSTYDSRENCNAIIETATNTLVVGCKNTTIPNSVTSIGSEAFRGCSSLTSINIPYSVTSIGEYAFWYCTSLTSVTIGNSVKSIGWGAFRDCSSLTSVTIGNSVTSIGNDAFNGCSSLTSITIPNSVTSIGHHAFYGCASLTSITIPNSVTSIEVAVFGSCSSLTSITIHDSVNSIGEGAFSGCSSLTSIVVDGNNTTYDSRDNCNAIIETATNTLIAGCQNTIIPKGVTSIGNYAFSSCASLTSITIPNSVTSIGKWAFADCRSLASLTIPNSVTSIGNYAFSGCASLTSPVYNAHCFTYLPTSFEGTYIVPDGIKQIAGGAFYECSSLTSVTIPNSVTSIGESAFEHCSSLSSVTIGNSVTSIGNYAFNGCSSLASITIPNSVTSIGKYAFGGCSSLTSITIPNSVTSIGYGAFRHCTSLTSITIGNSVTSIEIFTFDGCSALDTISINATTPPTLGEKALSSVSICYIPMCTQVDYVNSNWNDYVDTFEEYLLYAGSYGPNIKWKYKDSKLSLSGMGNISKLDCTPWELLIDSIKEIEIENGITKIPADAFSNYTKLNKITLPSSLEEIGANAFANCRRLYEIYSYASIPPLAEVSSFTNYNATLYVPCEHKQYYQSDMVFILFNKVECISSEEVETDGVIVVPGANNVTITWLKEDGAETYSIVIKKDGEVVCTLTFNSEGQLINIAFAPGRNGNHPAQYAEAVANGGFRFTVTGLEEGTDYTYTVTSKDAANKTISEHSGEFTTNSATALDNTHSQSPITNCQKILRNGQLIILRDGVEYNAMGAEIQ